MIKIIVALYILFISYAGFAAEENGNKKILNITCATSMCRLVNFSEIEQKFNVVINIFPAGSIEVFSNLATKKADIALVVGQKSNFNMQPLGVNPNNFAEETLGYMRLAFIINEKTLVTDLTKEQLSQIYSGKINNWQILGGNNAPIVILSVDNTNTTYYQVLETLSLEKYAPSILIDNKASVRDIALQVSRNQNAIGAIVYHKQNAYLYHNSVKEVMEPKLLPASIIIRQDASEALSAVIALIKEQTKYVYYK
jgi:ABC-type phosphate transport system substrate-binding protein